MDTNKKTGLQIGAVVLTLAGAFGAEITDRQAHKPDAPIGANRTEVPPAIAPTQIAPHISLTPVVPPTPPDPYPLTPPAPVETKPEPTPLPQGKPSKPPHEQPTRRRRTY